MEEGKKGRDREKKESLCFPDVSIPPYSVKRMEFSTN